MSRSDSFPSGTFAVVIPAVVCLPLPDIRGNGIIQNRDLELPGGDSQSLIVRVPVQCESKEKRAIVATAGEVVEVSGKDVSVGTWHRDGSIEGKTVRSKKWCLEIDVRLLSHLIKESIPKLVNNLFRSDPNLLVEPVCSAWASRPPPRKRRRAGCT